MCFNSFLRLYNPTSKEALIAIVAIHNESSIQIHITVFTIKLNLQKIITQSNGKEIIYWNIRIGKQLFCHQKAVNKKQQKEAEIKNSKTRRGYVYEYYKQKSNRNKRKE